MKSFSFNRLRSRAAALLCCVFVVAFLPSCTNQPAAVLPAPRAATMPATHASAPHGRAALDRMPLAFVPNRGQFAGDVAFATANRSTQLLFSSGGVQFVVPGSTAMLEQRFVGANPVAVPQGQGASETTISYFRGAPNQWQRGLPSYTRLVYANLWPGIDLAYDGTSEGLKYTFVVQPGADPRQIMLAYAGATKLEITGDGQLHVATPAGSFRDEKPIAFQEIGGERRPVAATYALANGTQYSFTVGAYDPTQPLLIDPTVLLYGGFLGGANDDAASAVALDSAGNAYLTGYTYSATPSFPVANGPSATPGGSVDAFVAKISADGTRLLYIGYLGGAGYDTGSGIAVDGAGNAYVTGQTQSDAASFPVRGGPSLLFGGAIDAFVAKVSADGTQLIYAGYIGGAGIDTGAGIAVDSAGSAYLTGQTRSSPASFPARVGPSLQYGGAGDAFVAKVSPDGAQLVYAGYIGGAGDDQGAAIAVDAAGNAAITGASASAAGSFPVVGGLGSKNNGGTDAFVARVSADGTQITAAGFVGGSDYDAGAAIALASNGTIVITGQTQSSQRTFPVAGGPTQTIGGGIDAFIATISSDAARLLSAGYIGGAGNDAGTGVAVGGSGVIYVAGSTTSPASSFPLLRGPGTTFGGKADGFLAKLDGTTKQIVYAGYVGGAGDDQSAALAVDQFGNATIAGWTNSPATTLQTSGTLFQSGRGGNDALVLNIATVPDLALAQAAPATLVFGQPLTTTLTVNNTASNASAAANVVLAATLPISGNLVSATPSQGTCIGGAALRCALGTLDNSASATVTIVVQPTKPGPFIIAARVAAAEPEQNQANNTTTQTVSVVIQSFLPLVAR